jgi:YD repeat-containing protein
VHTQNRLTKETLPNTKTNTYGYDPAGNLSSFADAGGTVTYNYDAANELANLVDPAGKQTTFAYDNDHNRTQINYPNGVTRFTTYDTANRITSIVGKKIASGSVLTSLSYNYASGGVDTVPKFGARPEKSPILRRDAIFGTPDAEDAWVQFEAEFGSTPGTSK